MRRVVVTLMVGGLAAATAADDSVVGSKHDLSVWGPGPVRAVAETEVCIFCHAPHNAAPASPLWNRYNPTTYYRVYRSRSLDARIGQPGPASKMCLSCHDGSVALGLVLSRPVTDPIAMTALYMPTGPSNLTNDLSDDHPIGFRYDRTLANRDRQLRPPDLVDHRIHLGERGELECTACHDPHNNALGNFLRIPDRAGTLCRTCHNLDGWALSAHANSAWTILPSATGGEPLPYATLADNACAACHLSHSAPYRENLLYDQPSRLCLGCHNGLGGADLHGVLNQRYGHRINTWQPHRPEPAARPRVSQRVECTDCHNPHAAQKALTTLSVSLTTQGPLVPPAMQRVPGVSLSGRPVENAGYYYEVCFRCHADRPVLIRDRIIRQRDTAGNVRRQFLPTAASAHPVTTPARNLAEVPSLRPEYRARAYISCQDCHNNPDAVANGGLEVNGPHGSRYRYLLVARYETTDFTTESPQAYDLCYRCHDRTSILGDQSFPYHSEHVIRGRSPCSACHTAHGVSGSPAEHSHLINFDLSIVGGRRQFIDLGRFRGSCTLTCHGVNHVNFTYGP